MVAIVTSIIPPTMDSYAENQLKACTCFCTLAEYSIAAQKIPPINLNTIVLILGKKGHTQFQFLKPTE